MATRRKKKSVSRTKKAVKKSSSKVIIYTTPSCPWCHRVKEFFNENKIKYTEYDVSANSSKLNEMVEKSGQMSVPVVDVNDEIIVGFDEYALMKALNIK